MSTVACDDECCFAVYMPPLTTREISVLNMLAGDLCVRDIADALFISYNTVRTHTASIYRKLNVTTRADAVRKGQAQGYLKPKIKLISCPYCGGEFIHP